MTSGLLRNQLYHVIYWYQLITSTQFVRGFYQLKFQIFLDVN